MIDLNGNEVKEVVVSDDDLKRKKIDLFAWLTDLNFDKKYLFSETTQADFAPFMINRGMSQNIDTVMYANEMNKHSTASKEMVHDFYFYILSKKKRFGKWAKQTTTDKETLDLIMKHYSINYKRAIEYLALMTDDDIKHLKDMYDVGGKKNAKS